MEIPREVMEMLEEIAEAEDNPTHQGNCGLTWEPWSH
jgi:hypothetical protein